MKTKEFREYLEKQELFFTETEEYFEVESLIRVYKKHKEINPIWKLINTPKFIDIYKKSIEYTETPLEEREEEKKYYLRFPSGFNQILTYLGLSMRGYDCVGFDSSELYKKQFTQKEIDAMPFDTNFFIKEEVK